MASILTDVTNTIQNDNMMFPMDLKPSPITIPPAPSTSSMPLASPVTRAYSSDQAEQHYQQDPFARLLEKLDKQDINKVEHKTIKEIEDELQGRPLRGINFGPGPAWKMENRRNYYYQWNPSKLSKWDPELAKTKKQIEKEDALKEYENMGGKRYSRKNIKKRRRKTKKNKKRKTKRRQRKGKKRSRKR
tara:strand:+ start:659 stop:1225 length:567 start_codon:yes stop_codon:yes gene_type:complete